MRTLRACTRLQSVPQMQVMLTKHEGRKRLQAPFPASPAIQQTAMAACLQVPTLVRLLSGALAANGGDEEIAVNCLGALGAIVQRGEEGAEAVLDIQGGSYVCSCSGGASAA